MSWQVDHITYQSWYSIVFPSNNLCTMPKPCVKRWLLLRTIEIVIHKSLCKFSCTIFCFFSLFLNSFYRSPVTCIRWALLSKIRSNIDGIIYMVLNWIETRLVFFQTFLPACVAILPFDDEDRSNVDSIYHVWFMIINITHACVQVYL